MRFTMYYMYYVITGTDTIIAEQLIDQSECADIADIKKVAIQLRMKHGKGACYTYDNLDDYWYRTHWFKNTVLTRCRQTVVTKDKVPKQLKVLQLIGA